MFDKLKNTVADFKYDIYYCLLLLILFIVASIYIGPVFGDLYIDSTRESYVPELMVKGQVLHKDVFTLYNPLAYLVNAVFYYIFGAKFKVLYFVSYVNAWFVIAAVYFICRAFIQRFYSFAMSMVFMSFFVLGNCLAVVSYIYPYSYGFIYATTFFTYSVLFFIYYLKSNNKKMIYLSGLSLGLAYANKPEFLLCFIPVLVALIIKKSGIKYILSYISLLLIPTILSYGILFLQGMTIADMKEFLDFCIGWAKSPEQIYFNTHEMCPAWNIENLKILFKAFSVVVFYLSVCAAFFSLFFKNKFYKTIGFFILPFYTFLNLYYFLHMWVDERHYNFFSFRIVLLLIILCFAIFKLKNLNDKILFFLAITGILSTSRVGFMPIHKSMYGVYMFLPLVSIWIYFINSKFKICDSFDYKKYVAWASIFMSLFYTGCSRTLYYTIPLEKFTSDKGTIYHQRCYVSVFKKSLDWVYRNTKPDESILSFPEGVFLNHISGRPTKNKYYQLTPNHISAYGEENIVNALEADKPDYIVINEYPQDWCYGKRLLCEDYGLKICDFIYKNYSKAVEFSGEDYGNFKYSQVIYKMNKNDNR